MKTFIKNAILIGLAILPLSSLSFAASSSEAYQSFLKGLLAMRSGDTQSALSDYEQVVRLDESAAPVYRDLAIIYWQMGKSAESFSAAKKFEELAADDLPTYLFLGSFYGLTGQSGEARRAWEKVLKMDPGNETAIVHLAAFHSSDNEPDKAIGYWKKFIRQEPDSAEAHYQLGLSQVKAGELDGAKDSFQKALSLKADSAEPHISLAQLYEKEGKMVAAAQEYERYLQLVPNNMTVLQYLGGFYYRLKNFAAAEDTFLRAKELSPNDGSINFWLGLLAEEKKDWAMASSYFELLSKSDPNPAILTRLSYYYSMQKNYRLAIRYLKRVARVEPLNPNSFFLLGLAYFDDKDYLRAKENLEHALTLKPDMEEVHFNLGILYDQWKKFDKAVRELKRAIEINPNYATALNYLGYSLADRGMRLDEAEQLVAKALTLDPDNGSYIDSLGWVYYKKGKYVEAEKTLIRAAEKTSDPIIWEHLGDTRFKLHNMSEAWDAYHKALELDPDNKALMKKIRQMDKLVLPATLQRKVLKRAIGNLLQISSLKVNFAVSGKSSSNNFRFLGIFHYIRPQQWRADIFGSFMAPQVVIIQDQDLKVYPPAMNDAVSDENRLLFQKVRDFFNADLLNEFDSEQVKTESKGRYFLYTAGDKSMLIDRDNGVVKEYHLKDTVILKFKDHDWKEGLCLPAEIDMFLPQTKVSINVKLHHFILNKPIEDRVFSLSE